MNIRAVRAEDHDAVWEIFHQVVREGRTYAFAPGTSREQALRIWIEAPRATYVAEENGQVLGTYYLKTNQPGLGSHVCNAGYMVSSEARGRGLGKAMCRHSLDKARRLGYKAMQFNLVAATNVGAIKLWETLGFAIIGTIPKAFDHAREGLVDAYIMYQWLEIEAGSE